MILVLTTISRGSNLNKEEQSNNHVKAHLLHASLFLIEENSKEKSKDLGFFLDTEGKSQKDQVVTAIKPSKPLLT